MPTIRTYHGASYEPTGEIGEVVAAEIAFDRTPAQAEVTLPRTSLDLAAERLMPGGVGAVWEIDARDAGVPHVWTGRVVGPQWSPGGGEVRVRLAGIMDDLAREDVSAMKRAPASAASIVREVVGVRTVGPPIELGTLAHGPGADVEIEGQSLADVLESLSKDRGEDYQLTALPGRVAFVLDWHTSPDRRDLTGELALVEGETCEPDMALSTAPTTADLLGVASSLSAGTGLFGTAVEAPAGPVLGRRAVLEAEITSTIAQEIAGTSRIALRPDIPTRAMLELALRARLQALLAPVVAASCQITDTDLWLLQPGDLVLTRWPTEPTGLFRRAIARIRSVTYSVFEPRGMTVSLELWALEGSA